MRARDTRLLSLMIAMLAIMVFCKFYPAATIWEAGIEAFYLIGALIVLGVLIYGTLQYRTRNRTAALAGDKIVRERYRHNES